MADECDLTKDGGDVELRSDQCVNALHGIADPAAYMAWVKRMEEAARQVVSKHAEAKESANDVHATAKVVVALERAEDALAAAIKEKP